MPRGLPKGAAVLKVQPSRMRRGNDVLGCSIERPKKVQHASDKFPGTILSEEAISLWDKREIIRMELQIYEPFRKTEWTDSTLFNFSSTADVYNFIDFFFYFLFDGILDTRFSF